MKVACMHRANPPSASHFADPPWERACLGAQAAAAAMERAAGLRAQVEQMDGLVSLMDTASTAMELLDLEVRP